VGVLLILGESNWMKRHQCFSRRDQIVCGRERLSLLTARARIFSIWKNYDDTQ
jgi:hypothetical protein